jgi:hypothetical protein
MGSFLTLRNRSRAVQFVGFGPKRGIWAQEVGARLAAASETLHGTE